MTEKVPRAKPKSFMDEVDIIHKRIREIATEEKHRPTIENLGPKPASVYTFSATNSTLSGGIEEAQRAWDLRFVAMASGRRLNPVWGLWLG